MLDRPNIKSLIVASVLIVFTGTGCETLHKAGVPGLESLLKPDAERALAIQRNREDFQLNRDHKALYWLLANEITNGMSLGEVEQVLGEPGELETNSGHLRSNGPYQSGDLCYRWGPDRSGHSAALFFRDSHLYNFNPGDYQIP
jgi:hypothetical protein